MNCIVRLADDCYSSAAMCVYCMRYATMPLLLPPTTATYSRYSPTTACYHLAPFRFMRAIATEQAHAPITKALSA
jgi:hypothetical protein